METIGFIAAMSQERDAVLRLINKWEVSTIGSYRCQRFRLADRDCVLITSGMGIKRAAQATRTLIEATHPQLLVSVGVAGAVNADLQIGDVVAARNTCLLDQGTPGPFQPLALLSDAARQAAAQALQPRRARLFSGTAVTTRGSQYVQRQPDEMTSPVLEMETVAIARVAAQQGIPLLSVRSISDGPRAPIPFDFEVVMDEEYNLRMGEIFKIILRHPRLLLQLLQMSRNTTKAADNAAIALVAALSQPGALILQR
jgi:adenosylhomocysteine nucleosidase